MAGCISSGLISQLGWVASVMVDAPTPQSISGHLHGACLKSQFCSSHWATPNALSLQSPGRAHCPSLAQSQVQPSHVSGCQFNGAPGQAHPVGRISAWHPASFLYLGVSPFCGQQRSVWKCSTDSPFADSTRAPILGCSHSAIW